MKSACLWQCLSTEWINRWAFLVIIVTTCDLCPDFVLRNLLRGRYLWNDFFFFFPIYFPPLCFESLLNQCTTFGIHSNLQQRVTVQLWLATISSLCWTCPLLVPCFFSKVRHWTKFPRLSFPLQSLSTATHLLSLLINFPTSFGLLSPFPLIFADFRNFECIGTKAEHHIQTAYTSWANAV